MHLGAKNKEIAIDSSVNDAKNDPYAFDFSDNTDIDHKWELYALLPIFAPIKIYFYSDFHFSFCYR